MQDVLAAIVVLGLPVLWVGLSGVALWRRSSGLMFAAAGLLLAIGIPASIVVGPIPILIAIGQYAVAMLVLLYRRRSTSPDADDIRQ